MDLTVHLRAVLHDLQCPAYLDLLALDPHVIPSHYPGQDMVHVGKECEPAAVPAARDALRHPWHRCWTCVPATLWADVMACAELAMVQRTILELDPFPGTGEVTPAAIARSTGQLWWVLKSLGATGQAAPAAGVTGEQSREWATRERARLLRGVHATRAALREANRALTHRTGPDHWLLVPQLASVTPVCRALILETWEHAPGPHLVLRTTGQLARKYVESMPSRLVDLGPADPDPDRQLWAAFDAVYGAGTGCAPAEALTIARDLVRQPATAGL